LDLVAGGGKTPNGWTRRSPQRSLEKGPGARPWKWRGMGSSARHVRKKLRVEKRTSISRAREKISLVQRTEHTAPNVLETREVIKRRPVPSACSRTAEGQKADLMFVKESASVMVLVVGVSHAYFVITGKSDQIKSVPPTTESCEAGPVKQHSYGLEWS